jgi:integrase/recombinase XerC
LTHTEAFLNYLQSEKRYSDLTVQAYSKDLEQFFLFINVHYPNILDASSINHLMIRSWLASLKDQQNTARTINRKISTLKSYFKFLEKQGVIDSAPTSKIVSPKVQKRLPTFVQSQQMETMLDDEPLFPENFEGKTHRLIIEILYATGMRRAELANLQVSQVEFSNRLLKIVGKGNKERLVPLMPNLADLIQDYLADKMHIENADPKYLLILKNGKPLYHKYIYLIVKKYLQANTTLQKNSPHVLRHTFATHLLNEGADINAIKELLGHASLAATQVYTHNSIEKLKQAFKKAHPKA